MWVKASRRGIQVHSTSGDVILKFDKDSLRHTHTLCASFLYFSSQILHICRRRIIGLRHEKLRQQAPSVWDVLIQGFYFLLFSKWWIKCSHARSSDLCRKFVAFLWERNQGKTQSNSFILSAEETFVASSKRRKLGQFVACAVNFKAAEHAGAEEFIGQFKRLSRHCKQNINYWRPTTRSSSIMFH